MTRLAEAIVSGRWAITMRVKLSDRIASFTARSFCTSRALVASSSSRMRGCL
jgi:hypothetical protein